MVILFFALRFSVRGERQIRGQKSLQALSCKIWNEIKLRMRRAVISPKDTQWLQLWPPILSPLPGCLSPCGHSAVAWIRGYPCNLFPLSNLIEGSSVVPHSFYLTGPTLLCKPPLETRPVTHGNTRDCLSLKGFHSKGWMEPNHSTLVDFHLWYHFFLINHVLLHCIGLHITFGWLISWYSLD